MTSPIEGNVPAHVCARKVSVSFACAASLVLSARATSEFTRPTPARSERA